MKINWNPIKNEYIMGTEKDGNVIYPSMRDLSDKYQVELRQLGTKAKKEGWKEQRQIYFNKITTRLQQKKIEAISEKGVQLDLLHFEIAEEISKKIKAQLDKDDSPSRINLLAAVALKAQELGKKALGENFKGGNTQTEDIFEMIKEYEKQFSESDISGNSSEESIHTSQTDTSTG